MKITIEYRDCNNDWDTEELFIAPLGWPDFYLHTKYSDYIEITIRDADWGKIHQWLNLERFHAIHPATHFTLYGGDATYFYSRYINQCRREFDNIIKIGRDYLLYSGWKDIKNVKPEHGSLCVIAKPAQHEITRTDREYPGWNITQGKFEKSFHTGGMFETSHNCFEYAELWKYQTDVDY